MGSLEIKEEEEEGVFIWKNPFTTKEWRCVRCIYMPLYRNGATDSALDCCIIRGAVARFESLTIIPSLKWLVDRGYIIDT